MKTVQLLFFAAFALFTGTIRADQFVSGQDADVVLGQPDFVTGALVNNQPNRFANPQSVAVDPTTGKVFVADSFHYRILRFSSLAASQNGSAPEAVFGQANFTDQLVNQGGAVQANTLNFVQGLHVDSVGRLWVADAYNHRILAFYLASSLGNNAPASVVLGQLNFNTATPGCSPTKIGYPRDVCVGPDDTLWVADWDNNRVLRFANATGLTNGAAADGVLGQINFTSNGAIATAGRMYRPTSLSIDTNGRLWVADSENHRVLRFDSAAVKADADGASADGVLGQINFTSNGVGLAANKFNFPIDVHAANDGRVWVADYANRRVVGFDLAASLPDGGSASLVLGQADMTTSVNPISANGMASPNSISPGPADSLFVADNNFHRVLRFSPIKTPGLTIKTKKATTAKSSFAIKGGTTGSVTSVTYRVGKTGSFKIARGTANWQFKAKLKPGKNKISVIASGPGGVAAPKTVTITRK